jgi:hypothetical protein
MQAGLTQRPMSFRDIFAVPDFSRAMAAALRFSMHAVLPGTTRVAEQLAA